MAQDPTKPKDPPTPNLKPGEPVIPAEGPGYPEYSVTFEGEFVKAPVFIRGTHSFMLSPLPPNVEVKVVLTHFPANPGIPNLKVEIRKARPADKKP